MALLSVGGYQQGASNILPQTHRKYIDKYERESLNKQTLIGLVFIKIFLMKFFFLTWEYLILTLEAEVWEGIWKITLGWLNNFGSQRMKFNQQVRFK